MLRSGDNECPDTAHTKRAYTQVKEDSDVDEYDESDDDGPAHKFRIKAAHCPLLVPPPRPPALGLRDKASISNARHREEGQCAGAREDGGGRDVDEGAWGQELGALACGKSFCCALTADGHLYSWGVGESGQLGYSVGKGGGEGGRRQCRPRRVHLPQSLNMSHVACGVDMGFVVGQPATAQVSEGQWVCA